ncbi:hypothetical protein HYALB_00012567 [Hymenoscyphus albidus]|uniref:Rhodopsin domain-containing protein n=1 Tax=Hymenoscyphus albidus TaxID=595503 RepID=A0A9N9LP09_9HELO|nr:hypothetical protein HYALB_00012567 [Hymenoscyphus albidus]
MGEYDNLGRVSKQSFLASTIFFFIVAVISVTIHFSIRYRYIRLRIQNEFTLDDGFLLLGLVFLIIAFSLLFTFIDAMYLSEAFVYGGPSFSERAPSNWMQTIFDFQKMRTVTMCCLWCSIICVKMSLLFFFKKLIDKLPRMMLYWKITLAANVVVSVYVLLKYLLVCPYYYNLKALQCNRGYLAERIFATTIAQIVADVLSDLMIVVIPLFIIWKIQASWMQKAALIFSLCLTIIFVGVTIVRSIGLMVENETIDAVWAAYWLFITAELGIIMASGISFRSFFITARRMSESYPSFELRSGAISRKPSLAQHP